MDGYLDSFSGNCKGEGSFLSEQANSVYINNISENGILIRDYPNKGELPIDSCISDIFVCIPPYGGSNSDS